MAKLSVVTSKRKRNDDGTWEDADTTWWNVTVWDKTAEHVADTLQKGDSVIIVGNAVERQWQNEQGETRRRIEINAQSIGLDLRRYSATVNRVARDGGWNNSPAPTPENDPWATPAATEAAKEDSFPF